MEISLVFGSKETIQKIGSFLFHSEQHSKILFHMFTHRWIICYLFLLRYDRFYMASENIINTGSEFIFLISIPLYDERWGN